MNKLVRLPHLYFACLNFLQGQAKGKMVASFDALRACLASSRLIGVNLLLAIFATPLSLSLPAPTQAIPQFITIQGKVTNKDGTNVSNGLYDFSFRLYDGAGVGATTLFTEHWTTSTLWTSALSANASAGATTVVYTSNTNEASLQPGQLLWNTTKQEAVEVISVNSSTNTLTISPTAQTWSATDTLTNRLYVKDGIFQARLNSLNHNWDQVDLSSHNLSLGVTFNNDGEMKPRSSLGSTPYALQAQTANQLKGLTISPGKTLSFQNSLSFQGTDGTTFTLPNQSGILVTTTATQTLSNKTLNAAIVSGSLTLTNQTTNGGLLYTNGSGVVSQLAAGTTGQCLTSTGGSASLGVLRRCFTS